ncbi:hypothetical protein AORI_4980 [Amycolatopsis keratiniphila]|uniref:Uncharacterized protein n=1 Tax=Amycolatopsis keratiniphila TaxID=129921 RepID=R4SW34_9PSEU|nr:hypothetical protein AORI_4980 [Amycolatopsis keratiniphila]
MPSRAIRLLRAGKSGSGGCVASSAPTSATAGLLPSRNRKNALSCTGSGAAPPRHDAPTAATTRVVSSPCRAFHVSVRSAAAAAKAEDPNRERGRILALNTSPGPLSARSGVILAGGAKSASASRWKAETRKDRSAVRAPIPLAADEIGTSRASPRTASRPRPSSAPWCAAMSTTGSSVPTATRSSGAPRSYAASANRSRTAGSSSLRTASTSGAAPSHGRSPTATASRIRAFSGVRAEDSLASRRMLQETVGSP